MAPRLPPVRWVWGIDPGNSSAGLSLFDLNEKRVEFVKSWTLNPWPQTGSGGNVVAEVGTRLWR